RRPGSKGFRRPVVALNVAQSIGMANARPDLIAIANESEVDLLTTPGTELITRLLWHGRFFRSLGSLQPIRRRDFLVSVAGSLGVWPGWAHRASRSACARTSPEWYPSGSAGSRVEIWSSSAGSLIALKLTIGPPPTSLQS